MSRPLAFSGIGFTPGRIVKHAARQLTSGRWTSKVGQNIDIEHTLAGLEGPFYGEVVRILKREL